MTNSLKEKTTDAPLYCCIDGKKADEHSIDGLRAAVFVFLYYDDSLKKYSSFINAVPNNVEVYIISTRPDMRELSACYLRRRCNYIFKENRGRDVSALLVAARKDLFKFDYFCFIHDKKAKNPDDAKYAEYWCKNFWINLIGQEESYIKQILAHFEENPRLGLMAPHPPLSDRFVIWEGGNPWGANQANCEKLCKELGVTARLDVEGSFITYGTAFWARRDAVQKLISKEWKYEDFPDEPLPDDGTVSHAIERSLGYITNAAGYSMEIVLSSDYINLFVEQVKNRLCVAEQKKRIVSNELWTQLKNNFGIGCREDLDSWEKRAFDLLDYCSKTESLYVWGDGFYALELYLFLQRHSIAPLAFIVDVFSSSARNIQNIPIRRFDEVTLNANSGILIAVKEEEKVGVIEFLERKGKNNYYLYDV